MIKPLKENEIYIILIGDSYFVVSRFIRVSKDMLIFMHHEHIGYEDKDAIYNEKSIEKIIFNPTNVIAYKKDKSLYKFRT